MKRRDEDPAEIEREIENTRQQIDSTLSELGERLSPGQLLDQALGYVREAPAPRRFASNLGRSVQEHPLPVVLVGVGLAWLALGGRSDGGGRSSAHAEGALERAFGGNGSMLEGASSAAHGAASAVRQAASTASDRAQRTGERARSTWARILDEQPLVLALAGLALGAALGGSLPATESEDALLGHTRDDALARGARAAREAGQSLRREAEHAAERTNPEPNEPH